MADLAKLFDSILNGDDKTAVAITQAALAESRDPQELVDQYMVPAMQEVGRRFETHEYYVPELLVAARAMKGSLGILRPLLTARGSKPVGRVVIGTVKGDLHDIGKGLVASMLEGAGFEVVDLGVDVSATKFVEQALAVNAQIIAMSALLTTTMLGMRAVIDALKNQNARERIKVIIGGAAVTQQFADSIGADGYAANANAGVQLARRLVAA